MLVYTFIIILLFLILLSLGFGLFFLIRDHGQSRRTVKALTFRIGLSLALFVLLLLAYAAGLIRPHGLRPEQPPPGASSTPPQQEARPSHSQ
jgi:hypothetical protein